MCHRGLWSTSQLCRAEQPPRSGTAPGTAPEDPRSRLPQSHRLRSGAFPSLVSLPVVQVTPALGDPLQPSRLAATAPALCRSSSPAPGTWVSWLSEQGAQAWAHLPSPAGCRETEKSLLPEVLISNRLAKMETRNSGLLLSSLGLLLL